MILRSVAAACEQRVCVCVCVPRLNRARKNPAINISFITVEFTERRARARSIKRRVIKYVYAKRRKTSNNTRC